MICRLAGDEGVDDGFKGVAMTKKKRITVNIKQNGKWQKKTLLIPAGPPPIKEIKVSGRLSTSWKKRVAAATVAITERGGQGVLVPGGFIITAGHCVEWHGTGRMTLGEHYIEQIKTKGGDEFNVAPIAVDHMADLAVLGDLDNQEFPDDCEAFDTWREKTKPVLLNTLVLQTRQSLRVHILSHRGDWITGKVTRYGLPDQPPGGRIGIKTDVEIPSGTSGGPVVDDNGHLVGVVSNSQKGGGTGQLPIVSLALPRWIWFRIDAAQKKEE